jgi:PhnB protein
MELTPYLNFAGRCRQAFTSYAEIFGGAVTAELPFPDDDARLMHCRLEADGLVLHGADALPGEVERQGLWVSLATDTAEEAQRIFAALSDGGDVRLPMSSTFFASQFGMCVDRFGIPWQVAHIGAAFAAA